MGNQIQLTFTVQNRKIDMTLSFNSEMEGDRDMLELHHRYGCSEPELVNLMARVLHEGDHVIDGGANYGYFTVIMSKLVGESGHVFAFEPGENNLWKYKENLSINKVKNVSTCTNPLWDKEEEVTLYMDTHGGMNSLARSKHNGAAVKMKSTVLDLVPPPIKLIKLDIEGAEEKALKAAGKHLFEQNCPYIVAEVNIDINEKFGGGQDSLRAYMAACGYQTFLLRKDGTLPAFVPPEVKMVSIWASCNVLFSTFHMVSKAWPEAAVT
jgi:FkbM family methyltransferase